MTVIVTFNVNGMPKTKGSMRYVGGRMIEGNHGSKQWRDIVTTPAFDAIGGVGGKKPKGFPCGGGSPRRPAGPSLASLVLVGAVMAAAWLTASLAALPEPTPRPVVAWSTPSEVGPVVPGSGDLSCYRGEIDHV